MQNLQNLQNLNNVIKQIQNHQIELDSQREKLNNTQQQLQQIKDEFFELKKLEQQLFNMAHYDLLTGLPNKAMLYDRLKQDMARSQRLHTIIGILFLDLDGFKNVNDRYTHTIGDKVLKTISNNVYNTVREIDTVARIGGDEFIIVLGDLEDKESCMGMINRILTVVSTPILIDNITIQITASIGITYYLPTHPLATDILIHQADLAMYKAKQLGKNCFCVFQEDDILNNNVI